MLNLRPFLVLCTALLCFALPVRAAERQWPIHEFSSVQLAPRESGTAQNQHPAAISPEALRQHLALVQIAVDGTRQALFSDDELNELVGPLTRAFAVAGPGDDVLLLSSSRRQGGILSSPTAVTARLFVQGGRLQLIVHDARYEFYDTYRGTHQQPRFTYGSRVTASKVALQGATAADKRADWVSFPMTAAAPAPAQPLAATPPPPPGPLAVPAAAAAPAAAPAPAPAPTPAAATAPRKPLDAATAEDIERRLETLKRLRDRNLITEEEYQQKRKEILQLL